MLKNNDLLNSLNYVIIEPHIHMYSRTTDDYMNMFRSGIRICIEPSFWLGTNRRYAGTFFDYFQLILESETIRSRRFGIDHYACISVNPKEAEDIVLAREVLTGMIPYLKHERCVAIGEIGFNKITANEEKIFQAQLELAKAHNMLILIHSPHDTSEVSKKKGIERIISIIKELNYDNDRILIDHNTEETIRLVKSTFTWAGMTVYPYSKLNPERVINILRIYGLDKTIVNSSADWGISDPTSLYKVAIYMKEKGFNKDEIDKIVFHNPLAFYRQSKNFKPDFTIDPIDPKQFQR